MGRHRSVRERDDVRSDRVVELVEQLLAAAVLVPGQQHVGIHRVAGARSPQRQRGLLAVVVDEHAVAAVEHPLRHRIEELEGRHHRPGGQHLDLEVATGHVVDFLRIIERVFVKDVLRRPRALPAHVDRALRLDDARRRHGRGRRHRSSFEEPAARRYCRWRLSEHSFLPGQRFETTFFVIFLRLTRPNSTYSSRAGCRR